MIIVATFCIALLVFTTLIHYEVLRALSISLPAIAVPPRAKLIVVIFGAFAAHVAEIVLYALTIYVITRYLDLGSLGDLRHFSMSVVMYFSAETFTSLGYGDVIPSGDLRMLAGAEALNGLLLIGWSASYTYIAMERFWNDGTGEASVAPPPAHPAGLYAAVTPTCSGAPAPARRRAFTATGTRRGAARLHDHTPGRGAKLSSTRR